MNDTSTICAISTAAGNGAIAIIRLSGIDAIAICDKIFSAKAKKKLSKQKANTIHFGSVVHNDKVIDEVLVSIFRAPNSYTGEDVIEISCHGSMYIQQQILQALIQNGARQAQPGEFTMRAFLNAKMDLAQAEAVADLIASASESSHKVAMHQMRGGFSSDIKKLREQLVQFTSLVELELDFSEEDVEFADRKKLKKLIGQIEKNLEKLVSSFALGNVIKKGIPVAIIGKPNVGKSTLLNALLNEEKAIVSELPGTTRDAIEDTIYINGFCFRFVDTAGLRNDSDDQIENIGIYKTYEKINQASIIMYVVDISDTSADNILYDIEDFTEHLEEKNKRIIIIANKIDKLVEMPRGFTQLLDYETLFVSAKRKENLKSISESLLKSVETGKLSDDTIVVNSRHYEALTKARAAIANVSNGLEKQISGDLLATDIRDAIHHLGAITGEITTDEILGNIFSKFCIGK